MSLLPDRAWGTWDDRFPAAMVHIPSRFAVRVTLFSATQNRYEPFPALNQEAFALGEHTAGSDYVALSLTSAGTTLGVQFAKDHWARIAGRVEILEPGEMLFRLSVLVEVGFLAPAEADARRQPARMVDGAERELFLGASEPGTHRMPAWAQGRWRSQHFCAQVAGTPAMSGQYETPARLGEDLEQRGWLHHPEPAPDGDWAAFRFYGNPREVIRFAVAQDADADVAASGARRTLAETDQVIDAARERALGEGGAPRRAVRDVLAWNSVWDPVNHRPYTCASRAWLPGFGGWGVWMSDAWYAAMMCAWSGDTFMARANVTAVLSAQQAAGNVPALVGAEEEWVDRTQLPVAAFMTWRIYLLCGDRTLLEEVYPALPRQLEWTLAARDGNANGLFEYGSSPVGDAQGTQTNQGALNESGMDNMAIFDDAVYDLAAGTLAFEEPGHNSLLALEWETLERIATVLGDGAGAAAAGERAAALRTAISSRLWDAERGSFAGRHWDGRFAAHLSPTSFFPLVAGAATPEQSSVMIERWLTDPGAFWGPLCMPSAPYDDPVAAENSYWRGRIWGPLSYWVWEGLSRCGRGDLAAELGRRAWAMFEAPWRERRHCHENYHASDPDAHDAHDSDPFYTWGALLAFIAAPQSDQASPWPATS